MDYICLNCSHCISISEKFCSNCRAEVIKCGICFSPFDIESNVKICKNCRTVFHQNHLKNWYTINSNCPYCKKELPYDSYIEQPISSYRDIRFDLDRDGKFDKNPVTQMAFQRDFWQSQKLILEKFEDVRDKLERKFYVVSPPGSGKTIIGLELIKRLQTNALVLSPNYSTQQQWIDKISLFLPDDSPVINTMLGTSNSYSHAPIISMTYHRFSVYNRDEELLFKYAEAMWFKDYLEHWKEKSKTLFPDMAITSIEKFKEVFRESREYQAEIQPYISKIRKKTIFNKDITDLSIKDILHPNTVDIIEKIKEKGIGVIILDECHHLTAVWAHIVNYLIEEFNYPFVIGLTATPPLLDEEEEAYETHIYKLLFGKVNVEIPTPAAVKQRNLAPYQDLIYLTTPSEEELKKLKPYWNKLDQLFERKRLKKLKTPKRWLQDLALDNNILLDHFSILEEAKHKVIDESKNDKKKEKEKEKEKKTKENESSFSVIEKFKLLYLYYSIYLSKNRKEGVTENDSFIKSLDFFYQNITSFDELLSAKKFVFEVLHESKNRIEAVLDILKLEKEKMNNDLHAVVVFDNASSPHLTLLIEKICNDRQLADLEAVLLLQDVIIADQDITAFVEREALNWSKKLRLDFKLKDKKLQNGLCLIEGSGSDWKTGIFTLFFTYLFEKSLIRCLIGPRSILGEGWDSIKLNTLVDLTSVSAYQTVIQTKGRAYRIDEKNYTKLSNIWDVAVVDPEIPYGLSDFFNIVRKHKHFYGLSEDGVIEKGIGHAYPSMQEDIIELCYRIRFFNEEMKKKAHERHRYLDLWKIDQDYENLEALSFDVAFDKPMLKLTRIKDKYFQLFDRKIIEENFYQYKRKDILLHKNEKIEDIVKNVFEMYSILDEYLKKTGKLSTNISFIAKEFQNISIKKRSGNYFRLSSHSTDEILVEAIQNLFHLNQFGYALPLLTIKKIEKIENPLRFYWIGLYGLKADEAKIAQVIWSRLVSVGTLLDRAYLESVHREQKKKVKVNKKIIWM